MKIVQTVTAGALLLSAMTLVACGNPHSTPAQNAGNSMNQAAQKAGNAVGQAAQNTGQAVSDSVITTKVKSAIFAQSSLKVLQIHVDTVNGVVTLSGTVDTQQQSALAAQTASGIDGVKRVENNLTVK